MPAVKPGVNHPPASLVQAAPSEGQRAWGRRQQERLTGSTPSASTARPSAGVASFVPEGQGEVPWHQIDDFRVTDALVGRIDYSTGNLMLAATDFDIAGVGQKLRLTRTYNSLPGPYGMVSTPWWQGYERWLDTFYTGEVIWYDATGATVRFTKNADGSFTTPAGYSRDLAKNADGSFTLTDRKSGSKETYDAHGSLTKVTDRNHGVITVDRHKASHGASTGFKVTETRSGRFIDLVKTDATHWKATDNAGRTVAYELDGAGHLIRTTDAEHNTTTFGYDGSDRLEKITTAESRATVFTYDDLGRVTSMRRFKENGGTGEDAPTHLYTYSNKDSATAAGTTTATDPRGHRTVYTHNADGEVTKVTDPYDKSRSRTYKNHLTQTATDAMGSGTTPGNVTTYGWDTRNNPTSLKLPTGATSALAGYQTVAGADLPGTLTTADGEKSTYKYDTNGNPESIAVTGTGGGHQYFTHNKAATPTCGGFEGQRCSVNDGRNQDATKTTFHYDAKGNLEKVTPPAQIKPTTYTYDPLGRPATVTDGRGTRTTYTYDGRDRITEVTGPTTKVTYRYDGDGNLRERTDATGTVTYQFDALSRETVRTLQDKSQTVLAYDAAGNVETYTDPAGKTVYTWDKANRLDTLTDPTGRTTRYDYDNNGFRTKTTYPGGIIQKVTPDKSSRPEHITATSPKGTLTDLTYTYRYGTDNKTDGSKIRTLTNKTDGTHTAYTYDSAGRTSYTNETKNGTSTGAWQYCYDQAGNLTSLGAAHTCPGSTTFTVNEASQITARSAHPKPWTYDGAGNETNAEATRTDERWTDFSQLASITTGGTTHDAAYGSTDNSERTRLGDTVFHNGPLGLAGQTTGGTDTGFVREPRGTLNSMNRGGKSYYYLTDALGSVVGLADETGAKVNSYGYSPRGVARAANSEQVPQPYRFAGGYQDSTGLYHLGARYYDPSVGRFTQPDPSGQEKNPYLYAEGDPVNRIDQRGLLSLNGVADALGPIGDLATGITHLAQKDTKALWGDVAGVVAGGLTGLACEGALSMAVPATLGTSLGAQAGCYAAAWGAGGVASNLVSG
ncbi:RHS repeat-associated core domain-containing protein [Streptomyces chrestomyceticus]|uniref:RHS repeat-associated core domain-containing protein n=1 Tax=Streptomyces chrestomyceticus TaxID=68185 RepID=UPI001F49448A|nr:RHS repeat-associated core domain-containing protein [Streptomyces chrestomyceticus]